MCASHAGANSWRCPKCLAGQLACTAPCRGACSPSRAPTSLGWARAHLLDRLSPAKRPSGRGLVTGPGACLAELLACRNVKCSTDDQTAAGEEGLMATPCTSKVRQINTLVAEGAAPHFAAGMCAKNDGGDGTVICMKIACRLRPQPRNTGQRRRGLHPPATLPRLKPPLCSWGREYPSPTSYYRSPEESRLPTRGNGRAGTRRANGCTAAQRAQLGWP